MRTFFFFKSGDILKKNLTNDCELPTHAEPMSKTNMGLRPAFLRCLRTRSSRFFGEDAESNFIVREFVANTGRDASS